MPIVVPIIVLAGCAVVFSTTLAAARGRLGVNQLAGIRFRHVMESPETWRAGHRAALVPVTIGCALAVVAAFVPVLLSLREGVEALWIVVSIAAMLLGTLIGALRADQAASAVSASAPTSD
jgi:hypothetical protein